MMAKGDGVQSHAVRNKAQYRWIVSMSFFVVAQKKSWGFGKVDLFQSPPP
jgi:hypothetical protein